MKHTDRLYWVKNWREDDTWALGDTDHFVFRLSSVGYLTTCFYLFIHLFYRQATASTLLFTTRQALCVSILKKEKKKSGLNCGRVYWKRRSGMGRLYIDPRITDLHLLYATKSNPNGIYSKKYRPDIGVKDSGFQGCQFLPQSYY